MNKRPLGLRTWIEVDKKAIEKNYRVFRSLIPQNTKMMAVVKSNAYGHGLLDFSREISALGVDWLGVDSIIEGLSLRRASINTPILVLGSTLPEMLLSAAENNISLAVSNFEILTEIESLKFKNALRVHIKIDSGMHRHGFVEKDMKMVMKSLKKLKGKIEVEGLFTHFAAAKNPDLLASTKEQLNIFKKWIKVFKDESFNPIVHAAATGGIMTYPDSALDMVRVGIGLYGLWPSRETKEHLKGKIQLVPAMSWKTVVSEIKNFPKGSRFGYDFSGVVSRDSKVAVCPVGYWHGYGRGLSGIGPVLVNGFEGRVLGRVSMDIIIVDVTDVPAIKVGDEVVLLGKSGKLEVSAEYLAMIQDGWWYEFVTRINPLIKRIYR